MKRYHYYYHMVTVSSLQKLFGFGIKIPNKPKTADRQTNNMFSGPRD